MAGPVRQMPALTARIAEGAELLVGVPGPGGPWSPGPRRSRRGGNPLAE